MERVAELERLARVAREQAHTTTNRETGEVLLQIARQYERVEFVERRDEIVAIVQGRHSNCSVMPRR